MCRSFSVVLSAAFISASDLIAQTGSLRVSLPSPTAASLGKFGDVPVALYTGVPDISIPLWTVQGRTLALPVTLKYHAAGIRVEEIGGWAGIGWTLEAGGAITRTVRGLVDELQGGYYFTGNNWYAPGNWPNPSSTLIYNIANWSQDGEPDRFFFNFAGRSGQFVFGPTTTSTSLIEVRTIPHQNLRIVPTIGTGGITSWLVIAEDGTRYTFGAVETTYEFNESVPGVMPMHWNESHKSTWQLTGIKAASGDSITLYYTPYLARHRLNTYREKFDFVTPGSCVPDQVDTFNESEIEALRLDSIKAAAHTVRFRKSDTLRLDALHPSGGQQEPRLDRITVATPNGVILRQFQFVHDYYPGNRLRLTNVFEQDRNGLSLPPHTFSYDPQTLPPRTSFAQDHWGFYNGQITNSTSIPAMTVNGQALSGADRTPNGAFARAGILTRITYPTGGYNEFVYEGNDYGAIGTGGLPTGEGPLQTWTAQTWGPASVQFTVGGTVQTVAHVFRGQSPNNCDGQFDCPVTQLSGGGQFWQWQTSGEADIPLTPGVTYTITADASLAGPEAWSQIQVSFRDKGQLKVALAGGVRLAELRTADAMGNVTIRKYKYRLQSDPTASSGAASFEPDYWYEWSASNCSYFSRSSVSKLTLGSGGAIGYREVEVWNGSNGEFGKSRHRFRSAVDASDAVNFELSSSFAFTHGHALPFTTPTVREWKRGQERDVIDYNATGQPQRRVKSTYAFRDEGTPEPATTRSFRGISISHFTAANWPVTFDTYVYSPFEVVAAWTYLSEDTTVVYSETGTDSALTNRSYAYANTTHLQLTQLTETNSNGTQRVTRQRYPADYATGSGNAEAIALSAMQDTLVHIHSPTIERWVVSKTGATETVLQANVTTFRLDTANHYNPYQTFVLNNPTGVTDFVPSTVAGSFAKDSRYLLQETANAYDSWGRIVSLTDPRGALTEYVYGGNTNKAFLTKATRLGSINLVTDIGYNTDQLVDSIKDEAGSVRYFTYDLYGRLRRIQNNGHEPVRAYGYIYSRTSPNWTFNSANPNAVIDTTFIQQAPLNVVLGTSYIDGLARPVQAVARGDSNYVSGTQYDGMGRSWRVWKSYSRPPTSGYDAAFTTSATTYHNNYHSTSNAKPYTEASYTPDTLSRSKNLTGEYIGTSPPTPIVQTYGVDAPAKQQYVELTDEALKKRREYRDLFGYLVKTILGYGTAEASTTLFTNDVLGRRTQVTDPRGLVTSYVFNTRGLQTSRTSPDAGTVKWKYDKAGSLRFAQDANQSAAGKVHFTNYDFAGRPLTSGLGTAIFDSLNADVVEPFETTEANWLVVRSYDAKPTTGTPWSLFSTQITPLTLTNVSGRLAAAGSKSNGAWQVTLFSYDADGQVTTRYTFTQANGGGSVLTALNTTVAYTRDLRGALTQRALTVGTSTFYQWYDYDTRGLLWKMFASTSSTPSDTADLTDTYTPSGQPKDYQFKGGPLVPIRYTIRGQTEQIGDPALTTYPFSARYRYHKNGVVDTAEFYSHGSPATQKLYRYVFNTAAYDALNRLKSADFSSWSGSAWTSTLAHDLAGIIYDPAGNLTALQRRNETGALIDNLTYTIAPTSHRLTALADAVDGTAETWDAEDALAAAITYDANGNLTKWSAPPYAITAITYDHQNLPLSITTGSGTSTYRYDETGQRITKQVGAGNVEVYVREGATVLGVFWISGSTVDSSYFNLLWETRVVGRHTSSGARRYYHFDQLGSTRAVVSTTGTVTESYDFEPWGLLMAGRTLAGPTKEGFTGKEQDAETGLDYFGARYYMPALGRWAAVDPLADETPEWSTYNYVLNNPLGSVDPDGRQVEKLLNWLRLKQQEPVPQRAIPPASGEKAQIDWAYVGASGALQSMATSSQAMGSVIEFASPWSPKAFYGIDIAHPDREVGDLERLFAGAGNLLNWTGAGALLDGAAPRAVGSVGLDANALINGLERGQLAALDAAIAGRTPTVSITAAKEFLVHGDANVLRSFLSDRGGRIGLAASSSQITGLQQLARSLGRMLGLNDAAVIGSAMREGAEVITRDEQVLRFLREAGIPGRSY